MDTTSSFPEFDAATIAAYPIFRGVDAEIVREVQKYLRIEKYSAGEEIWREGDEGDDVFLLLSGEIEITQTLTLFAGEDALHKRDKSLIRLNAEMRPLIGEIALCAQTPRSASVIAKSDIVIGLFTAHDIESVIVKHPDFGSQFYRNIASILAQRLIKANENVMKLTTAFSLALQRGA